ncbi:MAG: PEGA domain-containing protein [Deltaproteobacteria bacterium]|nr:PEGA domain-containing protein [Deltaproteobacteria bacterium]
MKICTLCKSRYDDRVDFCFRDGTPLVPDTEPLPPGSGPVLGRDLGRPVAPPVPTPPPVPDLASARTEPGQTDIVEPRFSFRKARSTGGAAGRLAMGAFDTPTSALLDVPVTSGIAPSTPVAPEPPPLPPPLPPPVEFGATTLIPEEEASPRPSPSASARLSGPSEASGPPPRPVVPQVPDPLPTVSEVPVSEVPEEATEPTEPAVARPSGSAGRVVPWIAGIAAVLAVILAGVLLFGRGGETPTGEADLPPVAAPAPEVAAPVPDLAETTPEATPAPEAAAPVPDLVETTPEAAPAPEAAPPPEAVRSQVAEAPREPAAPAVAAGGAEPPPRDVPPAVSPEMRTPVGSGSGTAAADLPVPKGTITLRSEPNGASVRIGDTIVGRTPIDHHPLAPGSHTVRVEMDGYQSLSRMVNLKSDQHEDLGTIPLESAARITGKVTLWGDGLDGAKVFVDHEYVGLLPIQTTLEEGSHAFFVQPSSGDAFSVVRNVKFEGSGIGVSLELQRP